MHCISALFGKAFYIKQFGELVHLLRCVILAVLDQ